METRKLSAAVPEVPAQGVNKEAQIMKLMGFIDELIEQDPDRAERFIESALAKNALRERLKEKKAAHPSVPAPWREAVKVAREAMVAVRINMRNNAPHLAGKSWGYLDAAIARIDALKGGK